MSAITLAMVKGWKLALICLISLPISTVSIGIIAFVGVASKSCTLNYIFGVFQLTTKFSQKELDAYGTAGSIAEEVFTFIRTVVAFGGEKREKER